MAFRGRRRFRIGHNRGCHSVERSRHLHGARNWTHWYGHGYAVYAVARRPSGFITRFRGAWSTSSCCSSGSGSASGSGRDSLC